MALDAVSFLMALEKIQNHRLMAKAKTAMTMFVIKAY